MMVKKVIRHNNSKAVIINKVLLDLLGIDEYVSLKTDGKSITIKPMKTEDAKKILNEAS